MIQDERGSAGRQCAAGRSQVGYGAAYRGCKGQPRCCDSDTASQFAGLNRLNLPRSHPTQHNQPQVDLTLHSNKAG
jgi:hypothetical protein